MKATVLLERTRNFLDVQVLTVIRTTAEATKPAGPDGGHLLEEAVGMFWISGKIRHFRFFS